jgi:hypothetical protein
MAPAEVSRGPTLAIEVAYGAGPHEVDVVGLNLPAGSRVLDALQASGLLPRHGLALDGLLVGVWNRGASLETPLRDGDRVELHRPLRVDPKEARRQRHARQVPPRRLRRDRPSPTEPA